MKRRSRRIPRRDKRSADDSGMLRRMVEVHSTRQGAKVLVELANVGEHDVARFRNRFPMIQLDDDDRALRKYREELRFVWHLPVGYHRVLDDWTRRYQVNPKDWTVPLWIGQNTIIEPNPGHLGLLLTMAVRDNSDRLGFCPNPECPNRYFLKERKNQSVCDRPACAKFKRNESGRNWWNIKGTEWRAKNRKKKRNGKQRQKRGV
jgi:hypothetical protein